MPEAMRHCHPAVRRQSCSAKGTHGQESDRKHHRNAVAPVGFCEYLLQHGFESCGSDALKCQSCSMCSSQPQRASIPSGQSQTNPTGERQSKASTEVSAASSGLSCHCGHGHHQHAGEDFDDFVEGIEFSDEQQGDAPHKQCRRHMGCEWLAGRTESPSNGRGMRQSPCPRRPSQRSMCPRSMRGRAKGALAQRLNPSIKDVSVAEANREPN